MEDRLQKILSAAGLCSRRPGRGLHTARAGDGQRPPAALGDKADPQKDTIALDGKPAVQPGRQDGADALQTPGGGDHPLRRAGPPHSAGPGRGSGPAGCGRWAGWIWTRRACSSSPTTGPYPCLIHPQHEVEKEYLVWVTGYRPGAEQALARPMTLDGQPLCPAKVRLLGQGEGKARLSVVIHEGKNRQIRRMCAQCGLAVVRLKRIREGGLALDRTLRPGQWRPLTETEQKQLVRETFLQE